MQRSAQPTRHPDLGEQRGGPCGLDAQPLVFLSEIADEHAEHEQVHDRGVPLPHGGFDQGERDGERDGGRHRLEEPPPVRGGEQDEDKQHRQRSGPARQAGPGHGPREIDHMGHDADRRAQPGVELDEDECSHAVQDVRDKQESLVRIAGGTRVGVEKRQTQERHRHERARGGHRPDDAPAVVRVAPVGGDC
jgi:hypothetical protein